MQNNWPPWLPTCGAISPLHRTPNLPSRPIRTISRRKSCSLWRDLGINRLSLGVQSFDEAELVFLQRRHTARQTRRALELIRAAGFENLGLDLMYGLPGQSPDTWLQTLETALSFRPEHLSCYQLTIAAGETPSPPTPFARRLARGELTLPDEEVQREFFLLTRQFLAGPRLSAV